MYNSQSPDTREQVVAWSYEVRSFIRTVLPFVRSTLHNPTYDMKPATKSASDVTQSQKAPSTEPKQQDKERVTGNPQEYEVPSEMITYDTIDKEDDDEEDGGSEEEITYDAVPEDRADDDDEVVTYDAVPETEEEQELYENFKFQSVSM